MNAFVLRIVDKLSAAVFARIFLFAIVNKSIFYDML